MSDTELTPQAIAAEIVQDWTAEFGVDYITATSLMMLQEAIVSALSQERTRKRKKVIREWTA